MVPNWTFAGDRSKCFVCGISHDGKGVDCAAGRDGKARRSKSV
jgi:hypothetical protein